MSDSIEAIKKHIRFYVVIGTSLIILTIVTVLVSGHHFGKEGDNFWNITVALIIATLKAALVASIFMHLFWDMFVKMAVIFKVLIFTGVFFTGMLVLVLWSLADEIKTSHKHLGPMFHYEKAVVAEEHPAH
jgi:cytochrome c oxidase subunit IV